MIKIQKSVFWLAVLICGVFWSVLLDWFISLGPFTSASYRRKEYEAVRLCQIVKPGMEMAQVTSIVYGLGKPNSLAYRKAEAQDIEFLKNARRSAGKSPGHVLPSDASANAGSPDTVIYPNNVLQVGGVQTLRSWLGSRSAGSAV
jgi:hypothetical protein